MNFVHLTNTVCFTCVCNSCFLFLRPQSLSSLEMRQDRILSRLNEIQTEVKAVQKRLGIKPSSEEDKTAADNMSRVRR